MPGVGMPGAWRRRKSGVIAVRRSPPLSFLDLFGHLPAPHPDLTACVIVPAKNEAAHLESTLNALANQVDLDGRPLRPQQWEVLLLINNSSDGSLEAAERFRRAHQPLSLWIAERHFADDQAHIGHVRKLLMDCACERLSVWPKANSLILSTDGDTQVAPDWIAQNLRTAEEGAEAIGGRILLHSADLQRLESKTRKVQLWDDRYQVLLAWLEDRLDPQPHDRWLRHRQHFGSSLGVRPNVYRKVGGLPPLRSLEDVAFYERLMRYDVKVRHSPKVRVRTSGRLQGRTAVGLAQQLSHWTIDSDEIAAPSVAFARKLFSIRRRLRVEWARARAGGQPKRAALRRLAADSGCRTDDLTFALSAKWFGAGFEFLDIRRKLENGAFAGPVLQPLQEAVRELEKMTNWARRPDGEVLTGQCGIEGPCSAPRATIPTAPESIRELDRQ